MSAGQCRNEPRSMKVWQFDDMPTLLLLRTIIHLPAVWKFNPVGRGHANHIVVDDKLDWCDKSIGAAAFHRIDFCGRVALAVSQFLAL
jgi:hypothetical protein